MQHGTKLATYSRQLLKKYSNIKYHEYPSMGAEMFHADGRTDRQTDRQTDRAEAASSGFS